MLDCYYVLKIPASWQLTFIQTCWQGCRGVASLDLTENSLTTHTVCQKESGTYSWCGSLPNSPLYAPALIIPTFTSVDLKQKASPMFLQQNGFIREPQRLATETCHHGRPRASPLKQRQGNALERGRGS